MDWKKEADDGNVVMVCAAVNDPDALILPGSTVLLCEHCGQAMWAAPSGIKFLKDHPETRKVCKSCILEAILNGDIKPEDINQLAYTNEQRAELDSFLAEKKKGN